MHPTLQQIIMDIMTDADLKARALADPAAVLAERGLELPPGHTVRFVEDTPTTTHIVLPCADGESCGGETLEQRTSKWW